MKRKASDFDECEAISIRHPLTPCSISRTTNKHQPFSFSSPPVSYISPSPSHHSGTFTSSSPHSSPASTNTSYSNLSPLPRHQSPYVRDSSPSKLFENVSFARNHIHHSTSPPSWPVTAVPYMNTRTRKRFRSNRPDDEDVHQKTLAILFDGSRRQGHDHGVTESRLGADTIMDERGDEEMDMDPEDIDDRIQLNISLQDPVVEPKQRRLESFFGPVESRRHPEGETVEQSERRTRQRAKEESVNPGQCSPGEMWNVQNESQEIEMHVC